MSKWTMQRDYIIDIYKKANLTEIPGSVRLNDVTEDYALGYKKALEDERQDCRITISEI